MKIINSNIFQVIYYYYYLIQGKDGRFAEHLATRLLIYILTFIICGFLIPISALIYSSWIGVIIGPLSYYYVWFITYKKMEKTGLTQKIIKKKPKIGNSNFLSIVFTILFTILSFAILYEGLELAEKIEDSGIQLIK